VKVKAYASLRESLGSGEMEVDLPGGEEATLEKLVEKIEREGGRKLEEKIFGEDGKVKPDVIVLVNGKTVNSKRFKIGNGDMVIFMPPVSGG